MILVINEAQQPAFGPNVLTSAERTAIHMALDPATIMSRLLTERGNDLFNRPYPNQVLARYRRLLAAQAKAAE